MYTFLGRKIDIGPNFIYLWCLLLTHHQKLAREIVEKETRAVQRC
jgi:hypothetical protein